MKVNRNGIPIDDGRVRDLTPEDMAEVEGAHERHLARVMANPKARAAHEALLAEINEHQATLAKVRQARQLTQATMADLLGMTQSEVSKLERRTDLLVSTLRRFIEAAGGKLRLIVTYDDAKPVELNVPLGTEAPHTHAPADDNPVAVR